MSRQKLEQLIASEKWFHTIDFGDGLVSPARFGAEVPPNYTLFGVFELLRQMSLAGGVVVDVGTMDGLVAFASKRLGAATVIATDLAPRPTFEAARDFLGLDIDYRVPVLATDLPGASGMPADLIVLSGILYHVFDPIGVLEACRRALKRDGLLIVETLYLFDEGQARMSLSPADDSGRAVDRANVFWRPSRRALEGMLQMVGFEVVTSIAVDGRMTMLGQARRPSEIADRSPRMQRFHDRYMSYANYRERIDLAALAGDEGPAAVVSYRGPRGASRIYPSTYRPELPLQPAWTPPSPRTRPMRTARSAWFHAQASLADARALLSRTLSR